MPDEIVSTLESQLEDLRSQLRDAREKLAQQHAEVGDLQEQVWVTSVRLACIKQCPGGYQMEIKSEREWVVIAAAVNQGIDAHLEAVSDRSSFDATTGKCLVHPDELHVLLRRLFELADQECSNEPGPEDLAGAILDTLGLESNLYNPWF